MRSDGSSVSDLGARLYRVVEGLTRTEPGFLWSLAAIAGWQLLSFVTDWLAKGRFRDTNPMVQMFERCAIIITAGCRPPAV